MNSDTDTETFGARYLLRPERFPAWGQGEPFGSIDLPMTVCATHFIVSGLSESQGRTIQELWPDFIGEHNPQATESTTLSIRRAPDPTFKKLDRWVYELDFDYQPTSVRMVGLDLMARLELQPSLRGALWIATETPDNFHGAFENFLRVVVAYAALSQGGVLVHSAAVVAEQGDDAWLFIGHSGAGKSTVSRLGADSGHAVLSDDLNPILPGDDGNIDVVGSPFLGDLGARAPTRQTLSGIYRLEQGTEDALRPIGPAETLASLMACSPYINFDPHRREALGSNLVSLATRLPAQVLTFRREGAFWPLLDRRALAET